MVKQRITHFTVECCEREGIECDIPFSIRSVFSEGDSSRPAAASASDSGAKFTADFDVDVEMISRRSVILRLFGVSAGKVILNGALIGSIIELSNTSVFDVKPKLKIGKNTLVLELDGAVGQSLKSPLAKLFPKQSADGIVREVELVGFDGKIIDTVKLEQEHKGDDVMLRIKLTTLGYDESARAVATLVSPGGQVYYSAICNGVGEITVKSANLWWPNRLGVQNLYKLCVNLYCTGEIEDTHEVSVPLCSLELKCDGKEPYLCVNGQSFFALGALYVPDEKSFINPKNEKTLALLRACSRADFNCLLVSAGAYYPDDSFYDECYRQGLAVIRDFCDDRCGAYVSEEYADAVFECIKKTEVQSLPSLKTLSAFAEGDELNLLSPTMQSLEERGGAIASILEETVKNYRYPFTMRSLVYLSELIQAEELKAVGEERRQSSRGMLIYSRLNDFYGAISSASIDVFGRWKIQHYVAKRVFTPVFVSARYVDGRVKFSVSSNRRNSFSGNLTYSICDSGNRQLFTEGAELKLEAFSTVEVPGADIAGEIEGRENERYISYSLTENSVVLYSGTLLFTNPKNFKFKKPNIKYEISGSGASFWLTLSSDVFAKSVVLDFSELDAAFEDNCFDITGNSPVRVPFTLADNSSIERLRREIRICSLYDVGREEKAAD